jgi:YesN/AraC family two-component response regulator
MDPHQPISILLVEDDETACEIIISMLAMRFPHARIHSAGDGNAGLECFRRHLPDIVITDINMPDMDGVRLIGNFPGIKPDARVIVVTAHSDRLNLERITSTGVDVELVLKPIDFETLFSSINRSIASLSGEQPGSSN